MPNFTQDWMRIQDASARRGDAPETIEGLRQQYFATRIAPEIIKRGGDDQTLQLAAQRFDSETKGKFSASQSVLTPEEQELARQDKQGTAGLNAAGDILKSFAGRVANSSADIASGLGSLIPYGGKERDSWSQIPANIIRGGAQRLMDETSQTTKDAYSGAAGTAADFALGAIPYVATMGISKVPAIARFGYAGKLATGATVGFAGGYGATTEQARQSLDRIPDEDLKRSILDQAAVDQKAPAVQAYIDANGDLRKTRDLLANHAGNVGGSVMAAVSPLIGMLGGTAGKVLANRAVGKLVEEGVSEPIARRMVAKSIADEAAKQTIGGVAKRVGTDMLMQGTGMGAAMAGGQYAATGAVADAMGRDRTDEEKAQIAHAGIEGFVGGALAAPFFTAMHKVDSAREQLDADTSAAKKAASEIKSQQNEMLAIARQRSEAQAAGDVNGIASADQSFQQAQQVIAANKEKLRQLNADDEGNLLGRDGNKTLVQQAKSLADVARNALTRSKADAVDQTNTAIQTGIPDQAAAIDRARRIERQYNDTGEIQQPAQNSPQVADTAYGRKQAQGGEEKTPHFDAAAGALNDAGGDLNRAINILRRKSPDLSPNQAAEEVVRAHRIIRNQQNTREGAEVPQQPEQVSKPIDPEQAKRGLIDLAEQGDLQGLRQSAADLANGDENAYNALLDSAFTGAKLRKDAAAKAASDAQKAQATDAAMIEKAKQHIAKSGGDLVDAAMRMRAANKNLTPAQASEYVTRAHMDMNRPAMEQANAQEAAAAARPVNGIAGINEQPTGNIIDGTATPIDYGPDVRPSVSTQAAIDRSPARASLPAPTAQDRLPSPDAASTPSIKPDTVIQVGPDGKAMPRTARTIQEEARQRRDTTVPSGLNVKVERPARPQQKAATESMPATIQEAAKVVGGDNGNARSETDSAFGDFYRKNKTGLTEEYIASGIEDSALLRSLPDDIANRQAHGMAKDRTLAGLRNLLDNGIDPNRNGGKLDTATLANKKANTGAGIGTASGNAYSDGPFTLIAKRGSKSIRSLDDIDAIMVNSAIPDSVVAGLQKEYPGYKFVRASNIHEVLSGKAATEKPAEQPKTIQQAASEIKPEVNASAAGTTASAAGSTASAAGKPATQPKKKTNAKPVVDPERDNLLVAIAKLGGIDREQAKAQGGFDPAEMNRRAGGLLPIFRKTGGQNLDRMAEMLHERGYPVSENGSYTVNALLDALDHAMRGGDVGTPMYHERKAQAEYEARQQDQDIPFDEPGTNWVDAASDSWMTEAVNNEIKPDAVAASELRSIEDEQRKPSAPGASGQEADTGAKATGGSARAGEAVAGREGGQPEGQGVSRQGTGGQAGELTLESYTDADLAKRAEAIRKQQEEEKRKAESERLKAQADRELKDFRLSGSSAPADVAMAGGQGSLFAPKTRGEREAEKANTEVPADTAHLSALQLRLSNERMRLSQARTEQEKIARTQIVDGIEKEIAGEREFLGLPKEDKTPINEDELLAQLGVENHPKTESVANQTTREMTEDGSAKDGKPIMPGDKFKTSSGRETTPYPKQKGEKYASQWLIDNATAEAEARGDDFNAPIFRRTTLLKNGMLTDADRDSMLMYLFGEQPRVVPSILKPLTEGGGKEQGEVASDDHLQDAGGVSPGATMELSAVEKVEAAAIAFADSGISDSETRRKNRAELKAMLADITKDQYRDILNRIGEKHSVAFTLLNLVGTNATFKNAESATYINSEKPRTKEEEELDMKIVKDSAMTKFDRLGVLRFDRKNGLPFDLHDAVISLIPDDGYVVISGDREFLTSPNGRDSIVMRVRASDLREAAKSGQSRYFRRDEISARKNDSSQANIDAQTEEDLPQKEAADKAAQAKEEQADAKKQEEANAQYIRDLDQKRLLATPADAVDHALRELSPLWNKRIAAIKQGVEYGDDYQMRQKMTFITRDGKYVFAPAGADGAVLSGVGWDVVEIPASKVFAKAAQDDTFDAFTKRLGQGKVTLDEFKRRFDDLTANKDAVMAELSAKTKDQLLSGMSPMKYARYRNDKKDAIVRAAYSDMLTEFTLHKSLTYGMDGPEPAVRRMVANMTEADLAEYASRVAERRKEIDEARKNYANALENPQSLEDYRAYIRAKREGGMTYREAFLSLNPEQREKYDALEAEATKTRREERQRAEKTRIEAAQQKTGASIVETKHTQKGHDLFVVKLDDRVDRDSYNTLNAAAKRLGGYYSSYRAGGAVPGFQFTERANAEAFSKLVQGDTAQAKEAINEKRDAFEDNKAQSAADRLDEMAQRLEETADAALNAERKTNTARRARFADAAMREAYAQQAMAKTMRNLSESIRNGSAKFLGMVRQKVQIETLNRLVASAHENYLKDKYKDNWYSKREERVTKASADHADFPTFTAWKSDLATLGRQLMQIPGAKRIGESLAKTADDVTEDYLAFARDNIPKVSPFHLKDGSRAVFSSKEAAENAIYKSGLSDRAIVLPVKRGENRIILSPKAAADLGVWNAEDKRITLKPDFADELVSKMTEYPKQVTQLHGLLSAKERIDRLKGMGIETPTELRAALREYIGLKEEAKRDKIKEMELSMVGRQNDGLDFFPTPEATVDRMIEEADIKPGMSVLEPEAGMGHIADRLREAGHEPEVMEISPSRRELLLAKGYKFPMEGEGDFTKVMPRTFHTFGDTFKAPDGTVGIMRGQGGMGSDRVRLDDEQGNTLGYYNRDELTPVGHRGTASGYDRIIMNPPFSNRQDAAHVMHAYDHLADGGRLVAIVGEGVFNGSDAKAVKFREWLSEHGARIEKLDAGTFNDPSLPVTTQANARMVVIDKKAAPDIGKGDVKFSTADGGPGLTVERARQLIDTDPVLSKASRFIDIKNSTDEIPSGAELLYSPAWHGSPHSFDKFSLDHIGTGEGAQAYGWGLYFAGSKEVAQFYRDTLASTGHEFNGERQKTTSDPVMRLALHLADDPLVGDTIQEKIKNLRNEDAVMSDPDYRAAVDWLERNKDDIRFTSDGHLYHVEIPDDGTYLLWDKPLSEQPEAVKKAISPVIDYLKSKPLSDQSMDKIESGSATGEDIYRFLTGEKSLEHGVSVLGKAKEIASKTLSDAGLSGIKYLDGSSRSKGEGNYNYVVFDDNAVKIIGRYSARKNQAEGYYHNGKVTLFADNIAAFHNQSAEERLKWVAFHELTHRGVAKLAESREYLDALDRAGQNPFIKNLASKIMAARKGSPYEVTRSIATEEALSEVSAALQTGDVSHLKDRYGLNFPESIRTAAKTAMQRVFEVVKRIFNRLTGRGLTDQQIGELLGRTMKAGLEPGESAGEATSGPAAARYSVIDDVKDRISEEAKAMLASDSQLSLLNRTLGTKLNIALRIPAYKAVHDKVRAFLNHTNVEAFEAVNKAPELLARNEDASDYKRELKRLDPRFWSKDQAVKVEERNILAAAKVIYENTLRADAENKKVFTDAELRAKGLNDDQIRVYRTFMDAVNVSLDNFAKANITRLMMQAGVIDGDAAVRLHNKELPLNEHLANLREQAGQMAERLQDNINSGDDSAKTARELDVVKAAIDSSNDIADKANRLKAEGYAPAMRFGEHTVTAYDESGRVAYFEGFDSKTAAIRAEKAFKEENPKWRVVRGTMSQEKFKQFQGLTPETVALFAKEAGYENDPAYQEYLKLAINNSSPLKRMIHRKGIAGYSQDLPRVLSSFVMSNARGSSRAIFSGQMQDALSALKQAHPHDGKLYDDAAKLVDYVVNPKEEAQFLKNMLFHFYLAGSFGFGLVNLLQPLHMTSAQIALYNGGKAGAAVKTVWKSYGRAVTAIRTGKPPQEYAEAFKRAQREGYLAPANTYALQGIERGRSGYAHTWLGAASHALSSIARITETINRTSTFIAAMDFAKATGEANLRKAGFKDAYDFATRAIDVTQGVYDKSNRPNAARGTVGSLLMAYKMYPINFIEFGARMAKEGLKGNPAGYTGLAMLLGVLAVTSGVTGLPLVQDLIDVLEGIFAGFGHPFNADRFMRDHMKPEAADVLMHGVGAVPGAPFDIASRMSMGRQVPGLPQLINPTLSDDESRRAGQQLGGAAENLLLNFYDAYKLAFGQGKYEEAVIQASPKWAKSVAKAFEMATKGEYTDSKGRKVRDVTALDAVVKALDIQPASISRQQRIRGIEMQDLSIQKNKEKYFADRMFDAAMSNDSTAMLQAQADLEKWNRDNPLYQVNIDYQRQVGRRVIEARKGPAQRLKTPKEMRWIQGEAMDASQ